MVADSSSEVAEHRGAAGDAVPGDVGGMPGSGTGLKVRWINYRPLCFIPLRRRRCVGFGFEPLQVRRGVPVSMGEVGRVGFAPAGPGPRQ